MPAVGDEGLAAVQNILVTVQHGCGAHTSQVRTRLYLVKEDINYKGAKRREVEKRTEDIGNGTL